MRKINVTIQIDDDDFREHELFTALDGLLGRSMIDYRVFPNTEHLKENTSFKKLYKAKKQAEENLWQFINNNR